MSDPARLGRGDLIRWVDGLVQEVKDEFEEQRPEVTNEEIIDEVMKRARARGLHRLTQTQVMFLEDFARQYGYGKAKGKGN